MRLKLSPKAYEAMYGKKPDAAPAPAGSAEVCAKALASAVEVGSRASGITSGAGGPVVPVRPADERAAARQAKKDARTKAKDAEARLRALVDASQASLDKVSAEVSGHDEIRARISAEVDAAAALLADVARRLEESRSRVAMLEGALADAEAGLAAGRRRLDACDAAFRDPRAAAGIDSVALQSAYDEVEAAWETTTRSAKDKRDKALMAHARRIIGPRRSAAS